MKKVCIGVDPGKSGAFAIIWPDGKAYAYPWADDDFVEAMREVGENVCVACVERVGARPGQGVTSMFSFGKSAGFIEGVLSAYGIPFELVQPQKWKKEFSITSDKNSSIAVCKRLFPKASLLRTERCKTEHDGMAEALLMAEYARRKL